MVRTGAAFAGAEEKVSEEAIVAVPYSGKYTPPPPGQEEGQGLGMADLRTLTAFSRAPWTSQTRTDF